MTLRISGKTRFSGQSSIKQGYSRYYVEGDTRYEPKTVADFAGLYSSNEYYRTSGNMTTFSDMFTHVRDSNATMVDSDGLLKWAPHNLVLQSDAIATSPWSCPAGPTVFTATDDAATTPEGDSATSIVFQAGKAISAASPWSSGNITTVVGVKYSVSIDILSTDLIAFTFQDGGGQGVNFNTSTGAVSGQGNGAGSSSSLGSGWWRLTYTFTAVNSTSYLYMYSTDGGTSVGGEAFYLARASMYRSDLGGMVDNPDRNDSYVPTTSSPVYLPRRNHYGWNGSSYVNKGLLLETEARTNLVTYSEDFSSWSSVGTTIGGNTTSPTGNSDAVELIETNTTGTHIRYLAVSGTTSTTLSVYAKASTRTAVGIGCNSGAPSNWAAAAYDLSSGTAATAQYGGDFSAQSFIESVGGGWYRCILQVTSVSATVAQMKIGPLDTATPTFSGWADYSYSGNGTSGVYVYGAQLEEGSTPSSYIPTTGATDTRALETLTIPAAKMAWPTPNVIGPELVTNGTFDSADGWTLTANTSISSGVLNFSNAAFAESVYSNIGYTAGTVVAITVDVTVTSGVIEIWIGGTATFDYKMFSVTSSGSYTVYRASSGTDGLLYIRSLQAGTTATVDNISVREIDPLSVSLQMQGEVTYADTDKNPSGGGQGGEAVFYSWLTNGGADYIETVLATGSTRTGEFVAHQRASTGLASQIKVDGLDTYFSPGVNVPFNISSRHGSTFVNGATDGTALTANTTPTALPDLSTTDFSLGYDYMGTIALFREDNNDWTDSGISMATSKPYNIILPVISGGIFVGTVLSVSDGEWADSPTITYQWLRNGSSIFGATTNTYTLRYGDLGSNISCRVTATLNGRSTVVITNSIGPISQVSSLFASGEDGAWYDPSDTTSLYQLRTGGDYADADGDVVGIMLDKSQMGGSTAAAFIAGQSDLTVGSTFTFNNNADSTDLGDGSFTIVGADPADNCTANLFVSIPSGVFYAVEFTINSISGDSVTLLTPQGSNVGQIASAGTYNFIMKSDGATTPFRMIEWAGTLTDIDATVVIREIPGNHAVAPSDAARPLYKTAGGLHWIEADGVDDVFDVPEIQLGTAALISLGLKQDVSTSDGWMPIGGGDAGLGADYKSYIWSYDVNNRIIVRITSEAAGMDATLAAAPLEDLANHILTWNRTSGTDMAVDLDSAEIVSTTISNTGNFPVRQILGSYATNYYEPGRLYGAVIRNAATSEDEQGNVEAYLAAKSGVTL